MYRRRVYTQNTERTKEAAGTDPEAARAAARPRRPRRWQQVPCAKLPTQLDDHGRASVCGRMYVAAIVGLSLRLHAVG